MMPAPFLHGQNRLSLLVILRTLLKHGNWQISVQITLKSCSNYIILHKQGQMQTVAFVMGDKVA
jgi:hypothetical protein